MEKIPGNPKLIKAFERTLSHPLCRKYSYVNTQLPNLYNFNLGVN